ncbi:MAG: hypothetical protein ACPGJS_21555, partial [Flammeovirgaceae bacterium]
SQSPPHELEGIFSDTTMLQHLKELDAQVCMLMIDFSPMRAKVIEVLNAWEIPVKAQLLLPKRANYRLTIKNATEAKQRYTELKSWASNNKLKFEGMALAIEPLLEDIRQLQEGRVSLALKAYKRLNEKEVLNNAKRKYQNLIKQMQSDGYTVDALVYPFSLDAQKEKSEAFQQLTGLIYLEVDRVVPLFYSNYFKGKEGPSFIISYGNEERLEAIGLGSTGGELPIEGIHTPHPLNWAYLVRDMNLAAQYADNLYIYSLEGCIQRGFLKKFALLDWKGGEELTQKYNTTVADDVRKNMSSVLKSLEYPTLLVLGIALVLILGMIAIWRLLQRLIST